MDLFDKQYVYCFYDERLNGKQGFFSDSLSSLRLYVNSVDTQKIHTVAESDDFSYQFLCVRDCDNEDDEMYRFFYYDPFYDLKVKQQEGHVIQYYDLINDQWIDCNPAWITNIEYRVKPNVSTDRLCTNKELMQWLAQGNGMVRNEQIDDTGIIRRGLVQTNMIVDTSELDLDVIDKVIRRWDDDNWHIPMISYLGNIKGEDNE